MHKLFVYFYNKRNLQFFERVGLAKFPLEQDLVLANYMAIFHEQSCS